MSLNFPATQHEIYETEFRKRFRDKSILSLVTNREWEGRFRKTGQTIHVPVLPLIHTNVTKPGEKIKYQEPKGAEETFTINRERYFAFKLEDGPLFCTDVYGADGLPRRNEMKPGVMQQPSVRCI